MITAAWESLNTGCSVVYAGWNSPDEGSMNTYVTTINVGTCVFADVNVDGAVNLTDATLFTGAYAAGEPLADLNHDGVINCLDAVLFYGSYACGCNPP